MHYMLFGGAFDPTHNGHHSIASAVLKAHLADKLLYVPTAQHPFLKNMTASKDRIAMLSLILNAHTTISTYELEKPTTSYSIETLRHYQRLQPHDTWSWLIGSDQLKNFHRWEQYEKLLSQFTVFVYPRKGFPFSPFYKGMVRIKNVQKVDVSSTMIRERIQNHESIADLVEPKVFTYIQKHTLYNTSSTF